MREQEHVAARESFFHFGLKPVIHRIAARFLKSDAAPSREDTAAVHRSRRGLRLVDVTVGHQLIGFIADVGCLHMNPAELTVNREIPLLAICRREIVRTAVDIQKEIVEVAAWESDRGKSVGRTKGRGRIELVARISKARRKRWIERRIVMAGILESIERCRNRSAAPSWNSTGRRVRTGERSCSGPDWRGPDLECCHSWPGPRRSNRYQNWPSGSPPRLQAWCTRTASRYSW